MKLKWVEIGALSLAFVFMDMNLGAHEEKDKMHPAGHHEWQVPKQADERANPISPTSDSVNRGKDLFQKHCLSCHGPEGHGDGPAAANLATKPTNLAEAAAHHSDGNLAWKIENGRPPMPAWKGTLSESQIWDVVNYVHTLGKGSIQ